MFITTEVEINKTIVCASSFVICCYTPTPLFKSLLKFTILLVNKKEICVFNFQQRKFFCVWNRVNFTPTQPRSTHIRHVTMVQWIPQFRKGGGMVACLLTKTVTVCPTFHYIRLLICMMIVQLFNICLRRIFWKGTVAKNYGWV